MNFKIRSVPFAMTVTSCLVLAATTWKSFALKQQNDRLRDSLAVARSKPGPGAYPSSKNPAGSAAGSPRNVPGFNVPSASSPLADEQAALTRARERVEKAAALLGVKPDDEVKSFGRIENLASEAVEFIEKFVAVSKVIHSPKGADMATEPYLSVFMDWLPKAETIAGLESQPAKIGKFHAAALQSALKLDAATTARLQPAIQAEFEKLAALQLTRPQRPEGEQAEWYKSRKSALKEASARIEAEVPASHRKPLVVEQVLHLGTGMTSERSLNPDHSGHGVISMGIYFPGMGKP